VLFLLLAGYPSPAVAQNAGGGADRGSQLRTTDRKDEAPGTSNYRIGSGDLLNVEVVGRRDLSTQYTVGQDGVLFMPLTGGIQAEGKTVAELSAELARRLSLYDRDITQVNVSVAEYRSRKILILGGVLHPGKFSFANPPTVWEAIAEAGGPTEDAQLSAVEVMPGDQTNGATSQVVDVAAAVREGRVKSLGRLKPGDTLRVPRGAASAAAGASGNSVFLFGAISRQGSLPIDGNTDLMSAIVQSGGPTPDADLSVVQIVRRNGPRVVHIKVNLHDYVDKGNASANPALQAGDTIFLRRHETRGILATTLALSPFLALASTVIFILRR